jgi:hypothetical protein
VWSHSPEMDVEELLKRVPLPISRTWDKSGIGFGLRRYFEAMARELFSEEPMGTNFFLRVRHSLGTIRSRVDFFLQRLGW